jgi:hypothetical protein
MNLRKKRTPRASQHYVGWRAGHKSVLLPVAGGVFLLTLPFIERRYRLSGISSFRLRDVPGLSEAMMFKRDTLEEVL